MKKTFAPRALLALSLAAALAGCASMSGSTVLVDGTRGLENFNRVGDANWSAVDGAIQATAGGKDPAYLVTKVSYTDFVIRAEFWASDDANSGIFIRCQNPAVIGDETCYEANIFDQRPDPTYGTGAIVKVAAVVAHAQGGRQVEHLRDHRPRQAPDPGAERREDGRRRGRQARQRADRAAVGARHDQVPQGRDHAALSVGAALMHKLDCAAPGESHPALWVRLLRRGKVSVGFRPADKATRT